jgi:hypothetical protein
MADGDIGHFFLMKIKIQGNLHRVRENPVVVGSWRFAGVSKKFDLMR